jgi:hypothetical protein
MQSLTEQPLQDTRNIFNYFILALCAVTGLPLAVVFDSSFLFEGRRASHRLFFYGEMATSMAAHIPLTTI